MSTATGPGAGIGSSTARRALAKVAGRPGRFAIRLLVGLSSLTIYAALATSAPVCPAADAEPNPPFGRVGDPPNVASWRDLVTLPADCHVPIRAPAALTIALAGRFTHGGSLDDLAARLGAVSETRSLRYWSVTSGAWRELVSDAVALDSADADTTRADFTAREILSGRTLYFAQNDTRSWGRNIFSVRVLDSSPDRLVLASENVSPIRLGPITLFRARVLRTVQFIDRVDRDVWSYFGLSVAREGAPEGSERSLVNRQAAFYRFLIGQEPDREPPLAP